MKKPKDAKKGKKMPAKDGKKPFPPSMPSGKNGGKDQEVAKPGMDKKKKKMMKSKKSRNFRA